MAAALIHAAMVPTHDANIADFVGSIRRLIDHATLV
ncbi:UNVERIFIED_ORG: hypothetical protein J2W85_001442 [Ensifer adhaerens]|nr:hypothetical protein [Ensifer adhaerens]